MKPANQSPQQQEEVLSMLIDRLHLCCSHTYILNSLCVGWIISDLFRSITNASLPSLYFWGGFSHRCRAVIGAVDDEMCVLASVSCAD